MIYNAIHKQVVKPSTELPYAGGCCINDRKHRSPEMNTNGETTVVKLHYRGGEVNSRLKHLMMQTSFGEVFLHTQTTTCDDF